MFTTLLESNRSLSTPGGSLLLSAVVHVAVAGIVFGITTERSEPAPKPDSFITRALFLPPQDRAPTLAGQAERLQFLALGTPVGGMEGISDLPVGHSDAGRPMMDPADGRRAGESEVSADATQSVMGNDTAFTVLEVDSRVERYADSDAPAYPPALLLQAVEGVVYMRYVVDTLGRADLRSAEVVRSSHPAFTASVLAALPGMRFRPAMIASRRVRQLVEQEFAFRIQKPAVASSEVP